MTNKLTQPESLEVYGYILIKKFIDQKMIETISMYMENKIRRGEWTEKENKTTRLFYYADPLIETILQQNIPVVEEVCGKNLYPTYSYMRVYQPGEQLEPHVDRPSCEISVTVNVASKGKPSKIWMGYKDNDEQEFSLDPGDAVVYKGCEAKHWRMPLIEGQLNVQFMLHYVDKTGVNAKEKYDRRKNLGFGIKIGA